MVSKEQRRRQLAREKFERQQRRRAERRSKARRRDAVVAAVVVLVLAAGVLELATGVLTSKGKDEDKTPGTGFGDEVPAVRRRPVPVSA